MIKWNAFIAIAFGTMLQSLPLDMRPSGLSRGVALSPEETKHLFGGVANKCCGTISACSIKQGNITCATFSAPSPLTPGAWGPPCTANSEEQQGPNSNDQGCNVATTNNVTCTEGQPASNCKVSISCVYNIAAQTCSTILGQQIGTSAPASCADDGYVVLCLTTTVNPTPIPGGD